MGLQGCMKHLAVLRMDVFVVKPNSDGDILCVIAN